MNPLPRSAVAWLLCLASPAPFPHPGGSNQAVAPPPLSRINVAVYTSEGRPVTDLSAADFTLLEGGSATLAIEKFQRAKAPLRIILLVDISPSMGPGLSHIKDELMSLVAELGPTDETSVISFSGGVTLESDFTFNADRLRRAVSGLELTRDRRERTHLYDAIQIALERLTEQAIYRTALVLVSDGNDQGSAETKREDVLASAGRGFVPVFAVHLLKRKSDFLERLAALSGGEVLRADEVAARRLDRVAWHLRNHYGLGYRSAIDIRSRVRPAVEVRVKNPEWRAVTSSSAQQPIARQP